MNALPALLRRKIVITFIFWCLPLCMLPADWFPLLGMPTPQPLLLARLLGVAYLALLVGYWHGLRAAERGADVRQTLDIGIASNAMAGITLAAAGIGSDLNDWGFAARTYLWLSAAGALIIACRLLAIRLRTMRPAYFEK